MHWANVKVRAVTPVYLLAIHGRSIIESDSDLTMPCLCLEPVAPFYIRRKHVADLSYISSTNTMIISNPKGNAPGKLPFGEVT